MSRGRSPTAELEEAIEEGIRRAAPRLGYLVAAALNGEFLWVAHQLLDWEWPGFLTAEFDDLLPIVTVSFILSIVANLVYVFDDGWPIKPVGELVTTVIGFVVALRTWQVFPFEFTGNDWSWLARVVLIVAMVGTVIGSIAALVTLVRGESSPRD